MILSTTDLKALWINGYIPTDWDFANLFDSYAPLDPATGQILGDGSALTAGAVTSLSGHNVSELTNDSAFLTTISGLTADSVSSLSGHNVSELTNDSAFITGIDSTAVTTALGYTPLQSSDISGMVTGTPWTSCGYYVGDGSAFATSAQGATADSALQPNSTADGTYAIYNDGTTSGQLNGITISGGLITGVTTIP